MDISIVICTCNRLNILKKTLASLGQVDMPAGYICKVIVVDSSSEGLTQQMLSGQSLPAMQPAPVY